MAGPQTHTPLERLRDYSALAPWSLRDLTTLACAILTVSRVRPVSAAARSLPNQRTIRFYVAKGLVAPPDGKGPAATYTYRHLLTVLAIKLRQMEGADLATIATDLAATTGDALERRVAATLGAAIPGVDQLELTASRAPARGRAGRILHDTRADDEPAAPGGHARHTTWHRIPIEPSMELHVAHDHPLSQFDGPEHEIAEAVGTTVARLLRTRRPTHPISRQDTEAP